MLDLDALTEEEAEPLLPKELELLKFEGLQPNNFYLMKHKRFRSFGGPRKSYEEIMEFFKNPNEQKNDYDFAEFNMEYAESIENKQKIK